MPKFACEFCASKVRVPEEFVGKRVKCPGCGKAITVPGAVPATGGGLDLSLLDDSLAGDAGATAAPRKLRSMVIGCGACGKTVHIPENRLGTVTPCPKCKARLRVDRMTLPETTGSTIDLKHIELEPMSEPSLHGGDTQSGGSLAGLTGTGAGGSRGGSRGGSMSAAGGSFVGSAQDQMAELRQLNDLKASGAITDATYRQRKAAIYAGAQASDAARKAMSRSASGATEKAIFVDTTSAIPAPLKWLIAVGVVALAGFLVWQYGIKPVLWDLDESTKLASEDDQARAQAQRRAQNAAARAGGDTEIEPAEPTEPAEPQWYELIPDLGRDAMTVAMVAPGVPGPYEAPPLAQDASGSAGADAGRFPAPSPRDRTPLPDTGKKGQLAFWQVIYPDGSTNNPMREHSTFVRKMSAGAFEATIGVGIGPRVGGLDDMEFLKYQNDLLQSLINGLARVADFQDVKPDIRHDQAQTIAGNDYYEVIVSGVGSARGQRISVLTGVQDGYAVTYWFDGDNRLYRTWQRDAVGNATIE